MKLRFTGVFNTLFLKVLELEEKDKMFFLFFFLALSKWVPIMS